MTQAATADADAPGPAPQQSPQLEPETAAAEQELMLATQPLVDPNPTPPSAPLALVGPEEVEMFVPKAGQKKAQYSWKLWTMNYVPTKASEEAASKVDEAILESDRWRDHAKSMQDQCEVAESRLSDASVEVERAQSNAAWQAEILQTEHSLQVQALEELLATERKAHEEQIAALEQMLQQERERCDYRVEEVEAKAAEQARRLTLEAEISAREAAAARDRADREVEAARAGETRRVQEARERANEQVRQAKEEKEKEFERLHDWVKERQQAMEEACMKYLKEKEATDRASKGYVDAAEARITEQREIEKGELERLGDRFEEWRTMKEAHYDSRPLPLEVKERADAFWRHQAAARMDQNVMWATSQGGFEEGPGGRTGSPVARPPGTGLKLLDGFPQDGSLGGPGGAWAGGGETTGNA